MYKAGYIILSGVLLVCLFGGTAVAESKLAKGISKNSDVSIEQAEEMINSVFLAIKDELKAGERVSIRSFGSFYLQERDAREARNPKTGEKVQVPARRYPRFKSSDVLKRDLNS